MDTKLLEFVGLLRQNGVRVSFAESLDTFHALDLVGLGSQRGVKDTLRATVNLTFDGRVIKNYHGPDAQKRFTVTPLVVIGRPAFRAI